MSDVLQLAGAILILIPFAWSQLGSLDAGSRGYLLLNLGGSALLAVLAFGGSQWGFFMLEATWAIVSAWSLASILTARPAR